jgi:hypothetical protein
MSNTNPPPMDAVDSAQQDQLDELFQDRWVTRVLLLLTAASAVAQIVECVVVVLRGGAK